ncbi:MAG: hypothetical protein ACLUT5_11640, partial [Butyricicoccus sp.]
TVTILGWRRPGKITQRLHFSSNESCCFFFFILKKQRVFACGEEKAKASIGVREKPSDIMRKRRQPFAVGVAFMRL